MAGQSASTSCARRGRAAGRASRGRRRARPSGCATTVVPRPSTVSPVSTARSAGSSEATRVGGVAGGARRRGPPGRRPRRRRRRRGPRRRAGSAGSRARTPQPTRSREARRRLGVVEVVVGQQHDGDVAGRARRPRRGAPSSGGPGSTTTERDAPGSRSTQVLVPSRVIGRRWARARTRHGAEGSACPVRSPCTRLSERVVPSCGSSRRASSSSPSTICRQRPSSRRARRRPRSTASGSAYCATSRQVRYGRRQHPHLAASTASQRVRAAASRSPTTTRSTRRGCAGPRAARRRRTRCGSAAARRPACTSAPTDAEQVGAQHQPAPLEERR